MGSETIAGCTGGEEGECYFLDEQHDLFFMRSEQEALRWMNNASDPGSRKQAECTACCFDLGVMGEDTLPLSFITRIPQFGAS